MPWSRSEPGASPPHRRRRGLLAAGLFLLTLPAVTTRIYAGDEIQYFAFLRSLWFDHDVSFENEYRHFFASNHPPGFRETFLERRTEIGRWINFTTIGCALLWSPFYGVADAVVRLTGIAPADGYSRPYVSAVAYASALYGFLSLAMAASICRRMFGGETEDFLGPGAAALVWIGTPLVFFMYVTPPMGHATSSFTVSLFVLSWLYVRPRWHTRSIAGLAALAALMGMVREQDLFVAAGPALDYLRTAWRTRREPLAFRTFFLHIVAAAATFAVVYLPQAMAYLALNGRLGPSRLVTRKMIWTSPHAFEVLWSPEHGFFFWTPLALVAIAGLIGTAAAKRGTEPGWIAFCMVVMVASQVYVNGSVDSWTLAGAFGQRRFVALTPLLVAGLYAVLIATRAMRRAWRFAMLGVIALAVWWNLALMVQFGTGLMDRQRLHLGRNAHDAFVTVPVQLPRLLARYLFDRESFYAPAPEP